MGDTHSRGRGYVLTALLGAIGGGLVVALVTRAIPKMMSQMGEAGCDPAEM
jgi:outer membrane lipoprotein SlyB